MNEYVMHDYSSFAIFYDVNKLKLFERIPPNEEGTVQALKDQVEIFHKSFYNTIGGCPCNASKRKGTCRKVYSETVELLVRNKTVKDNIFNLLNNPDKISFVLEDYHGEAFLEIYKDTDEVRRNTEVDSTIHPNRRRGKGRDESKDSSLPPLEPM